MASLTAGGFPGERFRNICSGGCRKISGKAGNFMCVKPFIKFKLQPLAKPYGAMYAIRTFASKSNPKPDKLVTLRNLLPSEIALNEKNEELRELQARYNELQAKHGLLQTEHDEAVRVLNHPVVRAERKRWSCLRRVFK